MLCKTKIIKAPCETCMYKNGIECFSVLAMLKTARAMEMELFNHGVEGMVGEMTLSCGNYAADNAVLAQRLKKIV